MVKIKYVSQTFESYDDRDSGALFSDIEFRECYFNNCDVSITDDPALRSVVRNVGIINCSQIGSSLWAAIVEDVVVDGFKTNGQLFQTLGAVFNRVVLRGEIGKVMFSSDVGGIVDEDVQAAFDAANAAYYRNVEWALDIRDAEFTSDADFRGVPPRLIRRDPETQVLVRRERITDGEWRKLAFQERLTGGLLDLMLKTQREEFIILAPKRHRRFRRFHSDIKLLRSAGIAEPD